MNDFYAILQEKIPFFVFLALSLIPFVRLRFSSKKEEILEEKEINPIYELQKNNFSKQEELEEIHFFLETKFQGKIIGFNEGPIINTYHLLVQKNFLTLFEEFKESSHLSLRLADYLPANDTAVIEVTKLIQNRPTFDELLDYNFFQKDNLFKILMGIQSQGKAHYEELKNLAPLTIIADQKKELISFLRNLLTSLLLQDKNYFDLIIYLSEDHNLKDLPHFISPILKKKEELSALLYWLEQEIEERQKTLEKKPMLIFLFLNDFFDEELFKKAYFVHIYFFIFSTQNQSLKNGVFFKSKIKEFHYLNGKGDYVLKKENLSLRLHLPLLKEEDFDLVLKKFNFQPSFKQSLMLFLEKSQESFFSGDEFFLKAINLMKKEELDSFLLQKKLKITRNRADSILKELERQGFQVLSQEKRLS